MLWGLWLALPLAQGSPPGPAKPVRSARQSLPRGLAGVEEEHCHVPGCALGTRHTASGKPLAEAAPETEAQGEGAAQVNEGRADRVLGLSAPEPCSSPRATSCPHKARPLACRLGVRVQRPRLCHTGSLIMGEAHDGCFMVFRVFTILWVPCPVACCLPTSDWPGSCTRPVTFAPVLP